MKGGRRASLLNSRVQGGRGEKQGWREAGGCAVVRPLSGCGWVPQFLVSVGHEGCELAGFSFNT